MPTEALGRELSRGIGDVCAGRESDGATVRRHNHNAIDVVHEDVVLVREIGTLGYIVLCRQAGRRIDICRLVTRGVDQVGRFQGFTEYRTKGQFACGSNCLQRPLPVVNAGKLHDDRCFTPGAADDSDLRFLHSTKVLDASAHDVSGGVERVYIGAVGGHERDCEATLEVEPEFRRPPKGEHSSQRPPSYRQSEDQGDPRLLRRHVSSVSVRSAIARLMIFIVLSPMSIV